MDHRLDRILKHASEELDNLLFAGAAEAGVQGVQLHTHFLAPSLSKNQILSSKLWMYNSLHTHILVGSTASVIIHYFESYNQYYVTEIPILNEL